MKYAVLCFKYNEPFDNFIFREIYTSCNTEVNLINHKKDRYGKNIDIDKLKKYFETIGKMSNDCYHYLENPHPYWNLLDTDIMHFSGDIIITDPCYLFNNSGVEDFDEDRLEDYDISAISHNTIYGDWSCSVFDLDTGESIGNFCADSGMVCVASLDDVLKFNPNFDYHKERDWTTTLIKDFDGDVQIKVIEETFTHENDTEWWKAGDEYTEYVCYVEGHGVNKVTGHPINFITRQTGL